MMRARYAFSVGCLLLGIAAMLMSGCDMASIASAPATPKPTATIAPLRITAMWVFLTGGFANETPALDRVIRDPVETRRVYDALRALPVQAPYAGSCPLDIGDMLHLTFYDGSRPVAHAIVKPDGCQYAQILESKHFTIVRDTDEAFWTTFAQALGEPRSALNFGPTNTGPFAPGDVPTAPASGLP